MQRESIPESRLSVRTETDKVSISPVLLDTEVSIPSHHAPVRRIDWHAIAAFIPWFVTLWAFAMWVLFLLIPTAFGLHYTGLFPAVSNWLYVAMGLVLCTAAYVAATAEQGIHAIAFTFGVLLLAYWF